MPEWEVNTNSTFPLVVFCQGGPKSLLRRGEKKLQADYF